MGCEERCGCGYGRGGDAGVNDARSVPRTSSASVTTTRGQGRHPRERREDAVMMERAHVASRSDAAAGRHSPGGAPGTCAELRGPFRHALARRWPLVIAALVVATVAVLVGLQSDLFRQQGASPDARRPSSVSVTGGIERRPDDESAIRDGVVDGVSACRGDGHGQRGPTTPGGCGPVRR